VICIAQIYEFNSTHIFHRSANLTGQKIDQLLTQKTENQLLEVDLTGFPNGIYYLELATSKGMITKKILKQN